MCGRFTLTAKKEDVEARFKAEFDTPGYKPRYNAAPSQALPVILNTDPRTITLLTWGLMPKWAEKLQRRAGIINVRAETLAEKHTFRKDLEERRCLILADGFYEWQKTDATYKIPFRILLTDEGLFSFAGLWEVNKDKDGREIRTFAIVTTKANESVARIHDRMPVILNKQEETEWLSAVTPREMLLRILDAYPGKYMKAYEVSKLVNRASLDRPEVMRPANRTY